MIKGTFANVESKINILHDATPIITQRHSGHLQFLLNKEYKVNDEILLSSTWQPVENSTQGVDVKGHVQLALGVHKIQVKGAFNLNGLAGNTFMVNSDIAQFPMEAHSLSAKQLQQQTASFFPLTAKADISLNNNVTALSNIQLNAGRSDLSGQIDVNINAVGVSETVFNITSSLLVIPTFSENKTAQSKNKKSAEPSTLFTDDVIPFGVFKGQAPVC